MDGDVLLVNMPFSGANRPQIGLGLLKAELQARGIRCDVAYLNLILAGAIGTNRYQWFSEELTDMVFAGEWIFAHHFFGDLLLSRDAYLRHFRRMIDTDEATIDLLVELHDLVPQYLKHCFEIIDWSSYSIIGFTSTFEQNMASLALAHLVKQHYPDKVIVMGGGNCGPPMGEAILRCFPFVDYVFSGESDRSFPAFVESIASHAPLTGIKGLVYRDGNAVRSTSPPESIMEMDSLPFPDYDDYFAQVATTSVARDASLLVYFETARGCWWGAKQHCTFCGLNALSMNFRSKSKERALAEILHLSSRYRIKRLAAVDNILDMKYFRELLPELRQRNLGLTIFYETKANLTREQVKLLSEAGITLIQPGIESFSFRLLKLMRKGVTPLQNIQLLKWCKEFEVRPIWNLLYGIPGESAEDYQQMLPLLESIMHLQPPATKGTIRLDRYSPYFQSPEAFGLTNAQPARAYRYIYPFDLSDIADLAYHYEFSFGNGHNPNHHVGPILRQLKLWDEAAAQGAALQLSEDADRNLIIDDTRPNAVRPRIKLSGWHRAVYSYCDQVRSLETIELLIRRTYPEVLVADLHKYLDHLVALRIMARDHDQFLSLALATRAEELSAAEKVVA